MKLYTGSPNTHREGLYTPWRHDANVSSMLVTLLLARARCLKVAFTEMSQTNTTTPYHKRRKSNLKLYVHSLLIWSRVSSSSHTHIGSNGGRCPRLPSYSAPLPRRLQVLLGTKGRPWLFGFPAADWATASPLRGPTDPQMSQSDSFSYNPADKTLPMLCHASLNTSGFEFQHKKRPV